MIAQEMADTANRGRVLWMLASSRPDLIEVDLKRPGRVDVKVPLLPTSTQAESAALVGVLAKRYGLAADRRAARDADAAHADAAHAGRRRSARRQSVSTLAHRERRRGRRARGVPRSAIRIPCPPTCSNSRCASRSAKRPTSPSCRRRFTSTLRSPRPHERQAFLPRRRLQRASPRHAGAAELVRRRGVRAARRVRESRRSG